MGYFVEVKWDGRDREQIQRGVHYISHREERLEGGRTRTLHGIGPRYRALRGDERAVHQLLYKDGEGLREPRYHRGKLTVDDAAAAKLARLSPEVQERVIRDAVEKTFRGELRRAQGVFVVHMHGGRGRPAGHPHAHFRLSPLLDDGRRMVFTPRRLAAFKERWVVEVNRSVDRALKREERTPGRSRGARTQEPPRASRRRGAEGESRAPGHSRGRRRAGPGVLALLGVGLGRAGLRVYAPDVARAARARDEATRVVREPGRALTRAMFRLATQALPAPLRLGLGAARAIGRLRQDY